MLRTGVREIASGPPKQEPSLILPFPPHPVGFLPAFYYKYFDLDRY